MDTMSFYFGIEDFERIRWLTSKKKDNNEQKSVIEIFEYKSKCQGEK